MPHRQWYPYLPDLAERSFAPQCLQVASTVLFVLRTSSFAGLDVSRERLSE